jgi:hypothetical protein
MSLEADRERRHTADWVLQCIDDDTAARLHEYADASRERVAQRLEALDGEWDTHRMIELEASAMGLAGLALGALLRPAFLAVPAAVGAAVFTHALTGWYPLMPIFRRLGLRTAREIARERYALKALRGDFNRVPTRSPSAPALDAPSSSPAATSA